MGNASKIYVAVEREFVHGVTREMCAQHSHFAAWLGFKKLGYDPETFTRDQINEIPLTPDTVVVASIGVVHQALLRLGRTIPKPIDLPEELAAFRGRKIWRTNLQDIRQRYCNTAPSPDNPPLFIKPADHLKLFHGAVVSKFRDLLAIDKRENESDIAVLAQEVVEFVAEHRYFIHDNVVVGVGFYRGDPLVYPDPQRVRESVEAYRSHSPVAYAQDFGVTRDGRTLLVELNDGYSLGSYGLSPISYAKMIEDRWLEMTGCLERRPV